MPLPRYQPYQPVKKKPKVVSPSLDALDDYCLSKIIAHALVQSKNRSVEPYAGDNGITERNLSLVSKRWYFLTQTQVGEHGVHKIDLEEAPKREIKPKPNRLPGIVSAIKTPRRLPNISAPTNGARTPAGSFKLRPNYGVLSQRNMTNVVTTNQQLQAKDGKRDDMSYNIRLFKAVQPKMLKYKHIQFSGNVTSDLFGQLMITLNSTRVVRLDLLKVKIEGARSHLNSPKLYSPGMLNPLIYLETLTYTITTSPKDDSTNALLWTIYQRATNLKELKVYLVETNESIVSACNLNGTIDLKDDQQVTFIERLTSTRLHKSHPRLTSIVFERITPDVEQSVSTGQDSRICNYSTLVKKVLSEEKSIAHLDTNDSSLIGYLIQASNRLCTRLDLCRLVLTCPIASLDLLTRLVRLKNLGMEYLSIVIDNFDQIGEVKTILEDFKLHRPESAKCVLNLYLKDQKFTDCEEKVKNLIQLSRASDVYVYISALQRISIDCCHLMWSTGRALQAMSSFDSPGKCIFKITLQTYPVKPNTVNPFEITIPFGRCQQYKISSTSEDVVRHREIMRSLKKDCYHQFVKSVRENNTP